MDYLLNRGRKDSGAQARNEVGDPFEIGRAVVKKGPSHVLEAKEASMKALHLAPVNEQPTMPLDDTAAELSKEEDIATSEPTRTADALTPFISDMDAGVRRAAIAGLAEIGDPGAIEALKEALATADWEERRLISKALNELGWEYEKNESGLFYCLAMADWGSCAEIGKFAVPPLISILETSLDVGACKTAALTLGLTEDYRAIDPLIKALKNNSPEVREAAASALGCLKRRKGAEPLIASLEDSEKMVREAACEALIQIGEGSIEPLVAGLKDQDETLRDNAVCVLDRMGDIRELQPLLERALTSALRDADRWARIRTASALADIHKEWVVKPLIEALYYYGVREAARAGLLQIGEVGMAALLAALRHRHIVVRKAAAEIVGEIGDVRSLKPLEAALRDKDWCVREAAQAAIDSLQDRGITADSVVLQYPVTPPVHPDSTVSSA